MKRAHVELYIEELVLHGFAPAERHHIGDAVERELARLFAEQGVPPALLRVQDSPQIDAAPFRVAAGTRAETVGVQVAQAVYGGLQGAMQGGLQEST